MRFGYWMPVFGGWLRNVRDEQMSTDWSYVKALAVESEQAGFDLSLLAELNLNDIKGHRAPALDAWTLAPAVAAVTERLELMLAVRPNYHSPSLTAKALSTLDTHRARAGSASTSSAPGGRTRPAQYGAPFDVHDARYARTDEWLDGADPAARRAGGDPLRARCTTSRAASWSPSRRCCRRSTWAASRPRPRRSSAGAATAYVMHGDPPEVIAGKVADMTARAAEHGKTFSYGVSGYVIVRDTEAEAQDELARLLDVQSDPAAYASYQDFVAGSQLESQVSLEEYSVSNRGLRAGLVGTPAQVTERMRAYEDAGVDLVLLQFSPQREEMARFGEQVIRAYA